MFSSIPNLLRSRLAPSQYSECRVTVAIQDRRDTNSKMCFWQLSGERFRPVFLSAPKPTQNQIEAFFAVVKQGRWRQRSLTIYPGSGDNNSIFSKLIRSKPIFLTNFVKFRGLMMVDSSFPYHCLF